MTESEIKQEAEIFFSRTMFFTDENVEAFAKHCVDKATGWRPIDDDAKSGKPMLVVENGVVLRACWVAKFSREASDTCDDAADYNEETDEYYWPQGWYEWNRHEEIHWVLEAEPTAYMPLPAPEAA